MIELYIDENLMDLEDNINVAFNYTSTDTDSPTAIKNTFSTSVNLKGTQNNNKVFGDIWKLDRIINSYTDGMFTAFDASKRVNFELRNNGDIIESGYIQLNSITTNLSSITYSITLYGGLGNFFYSLMYNDTDKEKSLKDLFFHWKSDLETENTDILGYWDKNFINTSWGVIETQNHSSKIYNDLTAIPCYNGLYEDFDNNKCLIDLNNLNAIHQLPTSIESDSLTYTPYQNRYALIEMPRELVEWEARDLRSNQQRIGLKFSSFFNAIKSPSQNGGYNVVLDDEILNSDYYKKSYIMLGKPNWSEYKSGLDLSQSLVQLDNSHNNNETNVGNPLGGYVFDLSAIGNPSLKGTLKLDYVFPLYRGNDYGSIMYNDKKTTTEGQSLTYYHYYWNGYGFRVELYDSSDNYIGSTSTILISNNHAYNLGETEFNINIQSDLINRIKTAFNTAHPNNPIGSIDCVNVEKSLVGIIGDNATYTSSINLNEILDTNSNNSIKLKINSFRWHSEVSFSSANRYSPEQWTYTTNIDYDNLKQWYSRTNNNSYDNNVYANPINFTFNGIIYDALSNPDIQEKHITKDVLFGGTASPFKYLVSFAKMFGLKFRYDNYDNTVYIDCRKNYYLEEIKDLVVDLNKGIKITPTTNTNKWYYFGLETPNTYASSLYNRKSNTEYGCFRYGTDYQFNGSEKKLFDDNIFKNLIPYRLSSYYFKGNYFFSGGGSNHLFPSVIFSPTFKYSLYNNDNTNKVLQSDLSTTYDIISNDYFDTYTDFFTKLCCFDSDNKYMDDIDNSLVFFNGFKSGNGYTLSDNLSVMYDLNSNPCYLFTINSDLAIINPTIPQFSKSITSSNQITSSFDFYVPNSVFTDSNLNYNSNSTIFNKYWKKYFTDLYDKNTKSIEVYSFIKEKPQEAMRKFYYFDNSYWVITEIKNYVIGSSNPIQMKLVKVNEISNYIS